MKIRAAGLLIINKQGQVLVLHRKENVPEGGKWGIPGGKTEKDNTFLNTAILKTTQETGLDFYASNLKHLDTFKFVAEGMQIIYDVWIAKTILTSKSEIDLNLEGHDSYKWEYPEILIKHNDLMVGMYPILKKYLQTFNT
jgi:ADP-ribose pyrophosphatase YjhB (NUDIX family)